MSDYIPEFENPEAHMSHGPLYEVPPLAEVEIELLPIDEIDLKPVKSLSPAESNDKSKVTSHRYEMVRYLTEAADGPIEDSDFTLLYGRAMDIQGLSDASDLLADIYDQFEAEEKRVIPLMTRVRNEQRLQDTEFVQVNRQLLLITHLRIS